MSFLLDLKSFLLIFESFGPSPKKPRTGASSELELSPSAAAVSPVASCVSSLGPASPNSDNRFLVGCAPACPFLLSSSSSSLRSRCSAAVPLPESGGALDPKSDSPPASAPAAAAAPLLFFDAGPIKSITAPAHFMFFVLGLEGLPKSKWSRQRPHVSRSPSCG